MDATRLAAEHTLTAKRVNELLADGNTVPEEFVSIVNSEMGIRSAGPDDAVRVGWDVGC
jgi:hypothetical protein